MNNFWIFLIVLVVMFAAETVIVGLYFNSRVDRIIAKIRAISDALEAVGPTEQDLIDYMAKLTPEEVGDLGEKVFDARRSTS